MIHAKLNKISQSEHTQATIIQIKKIGHYQLPSSHPLLPQSVLPLQNKGTIILTLNHGDQFLLYNVKFYNGITGLHACEIHSHCVQQQFVHFLCCIVFRYMIAPQRIYPSSYRWTFECLWPHALNAAINKHSCTCLLVDTCTQLPLEYNNEWKCRVPQYT